MPSKPLFGMPVVVGTSDAVMAMRRTLSCCAPAGAVPKPKARRAATAAVLRKWIILVLPPDRGSLAERRGQAMAKRGIRSLPRRPVPEAGLQLRLPQLAGGGMRQVLHELHRIG